MDIEKIIDKLNLQPLEEEGGMHRQTYVGKLNNDKKPSSTAIYYLLTKDSFSHLHRLPYDEIWHFYGGDTVDLFELLPDGSHKTTKLGSDVINNEEPQRIVYAGAWMGARLAKGGKYALLGTTMAPGYIHDDYEHGDRNKLVAQYPEAEEDIKKYTGKPVYK